MPQWNATITSGIFKIRRALSRNLAPDFISLYLFLVRAFVSLFEVDIEEANKSLALLDLIKSSYKLENTVLN